MKILCDVCGGTAAAVFCCADEAALCPACDRRVHRANKLAGKHSRFPLLLHARPLCDVCQERQGFVFCKEDRAILCLGCDRTIHATKRLAMMHSRFILTGTRLSSSTITPSSTPPELRKDDGSGGSSISDYLIKMLPGYLVEDLLVDESTDQLARKGDAILPFEEGSLGMGYVGGPPEADWNFCVPDAPPQFLPAITNSGEIIVDGGRAHQASSVAPATAAVRGNGMEKRGADDIFAVPQLLSAPERNKRPCRPSALYF